MKDTPTRSRLWFQIILFAIVRTVTNTAFRLPYPFQTEIAAGLGVDASAVRQAITARALVGFFAPLLGSSADVWGRRAGMMIGLGIYSGGLLLITLWPTYPALFASLILVAVGKAIFDPVTQASIGDRVTYKQRGLAIAVTEMSWSGAFLVGIPLVGWLMARTGNWHAPFPWLTAMGIAIALIIWRLAPNDPHHPDARPSWLKNVRRVATYPPALGALMVGFLIGGGNEVFNIVYADWLDGRFGLQVAALGGTAVVIGVAELGGEGLVAGLTDRIGKRRAITLGLALNVAAGLALPTLGAGQLASALIGLFAFYLTFEVVVVSTISLVTEVVPDARATMMAGLAAFVSLGRAGGALLGNALFAGNNVIPNAVAAGAINVVAIAVLYTLVKQD